MKKGDRFRLVGVDHRGLREQRHGTIIGESRDKNCWTVRFDGNKPSSRSAFHKSFVKPEEKTS
jgi:hypothetical protein